MKSFQIPVSRNEELWQDTANGLTLFIELDIKGSDMKYKTAGNLYIFPENSQNDIDTFLSRCEEKVKPQSLFAFQVKGEDAVRKWPFKTPETV